MIKKILAYFDQKRHEEYAHQLQMLQVFADQQRMMHENSLKIFEGLVQEVLNVSKQQHKVFETWMNAFTVTELPKASTLRDEDEVKMEKDRLREQGFPIDAELAEQVKWIVKDLGEDTL